jgi:hypothetical protein
LKGKKKMNYEEEKKRYISFCGSYCHLCDWHTGRIRKTFQASLEMLGEYGFKRLLEGQVDVDNFKLGLKTVASSGVCSGCKAEISDNPEEDRCRIRQCCFGKGFDLCVECSEFPCESLNTNPGVVKFHCIENLREIKEKGLKNWIDKQWNEFARSKREE